MLLTKNTPVKRRVEFFRRSTNAHLLTVPAINVPNDGYLYITSLPTDIPAKDIYALMFDDVGDRQLAGADKLSIKSKQVWSDSALLFHAEFNPGETTNERVSGTPFIVGSKSVEKTWVNGVLTTFASNVPTINEKGLYIHNSFSNYSKNDYQPFEQVTITNDTYKSLLVKKVREASASGSHTILNTITNPTMPADMMAYSTTYIRYIKPVNGITEIDLTIKNTVEGNLYIGKINFVNKTIICSFLDFGTIDSNNLPVSMVFIDPAFPDYYCIVLSFYTKANITWGKEIITWTNATLDINRGIDICNPILSRNIFHGPSSLDLTVTTTAVGINTTSLSRRYYYSKTALNQELITNNTYAQNILKPFMLEAQFTLYFPKTVVTKISSVIDLLENFIKIGSIGLCIGFYNTSSKVLNTVVYPNNWNIGDTLKVRLRCDKFSDVPAAVKTKYNLLEANFPYLVIQTCIENLTAGTTWIVNQSCYSMDGQSLWKFGLNAGSEGMSIKYFKYWNKPLPEDWLLL